MTTNEHFKQGDFIKLASGMVVEVLFVEPFNDDPNDDALSFTHPLHGMGMKILARFVSRAVGH